MKKEFKKGDKVIVTARKYGHGFEIGQIVTIYSVRNNNDDFHCEGSDKKYRYYLRHDEIDIAPSHPLIIKKITKARAGKKYHTWQLSKNKKVSNHQYNSAQTRNKQLNQFIEDIKSGNYTIE